MKNLRAITLLIIELFTVVVGYSQKTASPTNSLQHVVLLQWTEGYDEKVKEEIITLFKGLPDKIEGMSSFEIENVTSSSGNFDNVLIFQFTSKEA